LKNKETKATKSSKASEKRCLEEETIDDCDCKHKEEYQLMYGRVYDDYHVGIEEAIKSDPKTFFCYVDLKKKRVGYPWVMHFEGSFASGPDDICDVFADFIQRTYADDVWVSSDPGPDLVQDDPPFSALQITVNEVQSVLLELYVSKYVGPDGIPPLILKNCASFLTPIFKKGRSNNIVDYRGGGCIICNCESTWLYEELIDGDELVGVRIFCAEYN
jgi:hypothetical protein